MLIFAEVQTIYCDRINKAGGINGRKILINDYDLANAADKAGAAATTALTTD
jgi:ABC-type branched-subunit amino acid transport system substrate-binding protein